MRQSRKSILILTPFFSPNIGGVETHFDDLTQALDKIGYEIHVVTFSPITTPGIDWLPWEKRGNTVFIHRYRWFGQNLFHKLEKFPLLDFLYLTPYLAVLSFCFMLRNLKRIDVIHSQGLNAALVGVLLKHIFGVKLIVSTHAVYETNPNSKTAGWIRRILEKADKILCLSQASFVELESLGVNPLKLDHFRYWIDLDRFRRMDKNILRRKLDLEDRFTVLFIGRLIEKKGVRLLAKVAEALPEIQFIFIGVGPEEKYLKSKADSNKNIIFLGKMPNTKLPDYYSCSDLFCIPSLYEEGFGRVIMEAVACGVPVVGSNRGGITEAVDETVSVLVEPTFINIHREIKTLFENPERYKYLRNNCRGYAMKWFQESNVSAITKHYEDKS